MKKYNPTGKPVVLYGPGILTVPVGFLCAKNQEQQVQSLHSAFAVSNPQKLSRMLKKFFGLDS